MTGRFLTLCFTCGNEGENPAGPTTTGASPNLKFFSCPVHVGLMPGRAFCGRMKKTIFTNSLRCFALLALPLATSSVHAQFAIDWFTLDGGGGSSTGGAYTLEGTIGQPDAGVLSGGSYTVQGGFWSAFAGGSGESLPLLRILRDGANVTLAWPNPSSGFQLQESPSLSAPNWTDVNTAPAVVGDERQVNQVINPGLRFYRLRQP